MIFRFFFFREIGNPSGGKIFFRFFKVFIHVSCERLSSRFHGGPSKASAPSSVNDDIQYHTKLCEGWRLSYRREKRHFSEAAKWLPRLRRMKRHFSEAAMKTLSQMSCKKFRMLSARNAMSTLGKSKCRPESPCRPEAWASGDSEASAFAILIQCRF